MDIQTNRHTEIQTYRHTEIQTYRHTEIQTYRDTDIQTYRHRGNIGHNTQNKEKQNKILKNELHGHNQNIIPCVKVKHHNFVGTIFFVTENVFCSDSKHIYKGKS